MENPIIGNILALSPTRQIAVHQWDGQSWVAECRSGRWTMHPAGTWFTNSPSGWALRQLHESAIEPIPAELACRLEQLHRELAAGASVPWASIDQLVQAASETLSSACRSACRFAHQMLELLPARRHLT